LFYKIKKFVERDVHYYYLSYSILIIFIGTLYRQLNNIKSTILELSLPIRLL